MKPTIILIAGKKQSGKNTVADYIYFTYNCVELSFAEELKEIASGIVKLLGIKGITAKSFESEEIKSQVIPFTLNKKQRTYREFLQHIGSEWFREFFNESMWADIVVQEISSYFKDQNIIISDFRFTNEYLTIYNAFKNTHNIITIRVERESCNTTDTHISENALRDFKYDYVIDNNGTKEELYDKIDKLFEEKLN